VRSVSRLEAKFRQAFDAHFDDLNRYCLRRLPVDDVNDVVAEAFTVAWRKVDRMPDGDDVLPWLYGVARNEINNRRRAGRRFSALRDKIRGQAHHPEPGPESLVVRNAELQGLMDALGRLHPDDREVLLLRSQEELDFSGIGLVLGCSSEAARKRFSRAMVRLRRTANLPEPQDAVRGSRAITEGGDQ